MEDLGYTGLLGAFGILAYYMVIGGWVISYIWHILLGMAGVAGGLDLSSPITKEVTESFYHLNIENSPLTIACATFLFVLVNWVILRKGVIGGIERSVKYLMPLLFLCLLVMVVKNLTLDNAAEGIRFYLMPDFSKITPQLFLDVLGQVFFALSLGFGVMITLSSHLSEREDMAKTAVITGVINTVVAVMAGFMIFPSLFSANLAPDSGPSLVFKSLPIAFSQMFLGDFFAIVFFLLLVVAALTTSLTIYQVIISVLTEKLRMTLDRAINITLGGIFIFGNIPCILAYGPWRDVRILDRNIFDAFDFISGNICFVLTALGATLFVGWVMKQNAVDELDNNGKLPHKATRLWFNCVRYVIPVVIIAIFAYGLRGFFA